MIDLIKFKKEHWYSINEQERSKDVYGLIPDTYVDAIEEAPFSYSIVNGDEVLACFGAYEHMPGRAEVWTVLSCDCKKHFLRIHNMIKRALSIAPFERLESTVEVDFEEGHRWMKTLGFELEAPRMRKYAPTGKDYALYARVF